MILEILVGAGIIVGFLGICYFVGLAYQWVLSLFFDEHHDYTVGSLIALGFAHLGLIFIVSVISWLVGILVLHGGDFL